MRKTLDSTYQPSPQSAIGCLHQRCCAAAPKFVHTDHSNGVSMSIDDVSLPKHLSNVVSDTRQVNGFSNTLQILMKLAIKALVGFDTQLQQDLQGV